MFNLAIKSPSQTYLELFHRNISVLPGYMLSAFHSWYFSVCPHYQVSQKQTYSLVLDKCVNSNKIVFTSTISSDFLITQFLLKLTLLLYFVIN